MSIPAQGAVGAETMTAGRVAAERVCHEEQMTVWTGDIVGRLFMGEYLRDNLTYDERIEVDDVLGEEIRSIVGTAFALASPRADSDERTAGETLKEACKPWEHYTGEPPDDGSPLSGVFVAGMVYTERLLAKLLDVTHYEGGDGSEDFDADATQTLRNILTGARLWDADENRPVSATPAQPAGAVPDSLRALSEAASQGELNTGVTIGEWGDTICAGPTWTPIARFERQEDARFFAAAANYVRDVIAAHLAVSEQRAEDRREIERLEHDLDVARQERDAAFAVAQVATRSAATEPAEPWLKKADAVIAEMIAVATAEEGSDLADEWPVDLRAQVDLWQASLQGPLGHHDGFPSRRTLLASHPAGQSAGSGADTLAASLAEFQRRNGYHKREIEELLTEFGELLLSKVKPAPDSTRTGQAESLRSAMIRALDGHTAHSRDCHMSGDYLCQQVWPFVEAALAARPAAPEAQGAWSYDMEAAPRDGTPLLCIEYDEPEKVVDLHWFHDGGTASSWRGSFGQPRRPIAWCRLPAPPASSGQGGR